MKKIYLVKYDNGEVCEDYEEYTFQYCYTTKGQANSAIEELKQDKDFLLNTCIFEDNIPNMNFWVEEIELVEEK